MGASDKLRVLVGGKVGGSDERYTPYEAVDQELSQYTTQLYGKKIYLPCDQQWSQFVKWFKDHPELKCKVTNTQDDMFKPQNVQRMRDQDIIITNPPYGNGLEQKLVVLLNSFGKKFLLIGPILLLSHSKVFPLYRDGKIKMGVTRPQYFIKPDGSKTSSGASIWITNLKTKRVWPKLNYSERPLSSYKLAYVKDGMRYPYVESHKDVPDTVSPILIPASSLRYFNPQDWMFIVPCKPYLVTGGGNRKDLFHRILVQRKR